MGSTSIIAEAAPLLVSGWSIDSHELPSLERIDESRGSGGGLVVALVGDCWGSEFTSVGDCFGSEFVSLRPGWVLYGMACNNIATSSLFEPGLSPIPHQAYT